MFYENYIMYCKKIGKSKTDVAKQIGKTSKSVTGWKNGAVPRNDTLKKLATKKSPPGMASSMNR